MFFAEYFNSMGYISFNSFLPNLSFGATSTLIKSLKQVLLILILHQSYKPKINFTQFKSKLFKFKAGQ